MDFTSFSSFSLPTVPTSPPFGLAQLSHRTMFSYAFLVHTFSFFLTLPFFGLYFWFCRSFSTPLLNHHPGITFFNRFAHGGVSTASHKLPPLSDYRLIFFCCLERRSRRLTYFDSSGSSFFTATLSLFAYTLLSFSGFGSPFRVSPIYLQAHLLRDLQRFSVVGLHAYGATGGPAAFWPLLHQRATLFLPALAAFFH